MGKWPYFFFYFRYGEGEAVEEQVLRYIEDEGLQIIGAPRFSYIDGAWNKEDEAEWRTEIQVPVK